MSIIKIVQQNTNSNKEHHCIICGRSNGILSCHGCHSNYCGKHVIKHREELNNQLDDIMHDHNLLRQDIEQSSNEYLCYQKIDKWEKESIKKIQNIAQSTRNDLNQIFQKSKRQLIRTSYNISNELKSSWKSDDFNENDIKKWIKQLNDLRFEMKSIYSIQFIEDQRYPIYPITFTNNHIQNYSNIQKSLNLTNQEYFSKVINNASIENNGFIVKHIGPDSDYAHILGKQFYSQGRHTIRFKLIQSTNPYIIFFGCISSNLPQNSISYKSPYSVGWFGYNEIYQHGIWNNTFHIHGYDSNEFKTDDIIQLTFDCDHRYIEFYHERLSRTYKLSVNIEKAPLPWQLLVVLVHEDDCVKILPKR